MNVEKEDHAHRISKLEGVVHGVVSQVQIIGSQIESLVKHQETRDRAQTERDAVMFRKLDEAKDGTRPNLGLWAIWFGLVVTIIISSVAASYVLISSAGTAAYQSVKESTALADAMQQREVDLNRHAIDRLVMLRDQQDQLDREELQQLRLKP